MNIQIYPLKFDPIYQYRIWGGRKLENVLSEPLPENEPIGEAWLLSDRKDCASKVSEGKLKGTTLPELMKNFRYEIMGKMGNQFNYFPLLLKFLDCKELLSVQVHPSDDQKAFLKYFLLEMHCSKEEMIIRSEKQVWTVFRLEMRKKPNELLKQSLLVQ